MPSRWRSGRCRGGEFAGLSLLICRPTSATAPVAALYYIHGGGMIVADNRDGLDEVLVYAKELELCGGVRRVPSGS